ncbi:MAG TPA: hypothetical protein VKU02_18820 [Gemmataceae bacterium]|nr:hypothetical protein [Gemmataceae bacterium]
MILVLAKAEAQMEDGERIYLTGQIWKLEQSNRRWKRATFVLAVPLALLLIVAPATSFLLGMLHIRQTSKAAQMEMEARAAAEAARQRANGQQAKQAAEMPHGAADKNREADPQN